MGILNSIVEACETVGTTFHSIGDWLVEHMPTCGIGDCLREEEHRGMHADEQGRQWWGLIKPPPANQYEKPTVTKLCGNRLGWLACSRLDGHRGLGTGCWYTINVEPLRDSDNVLHFRIGEED